MNPTKNYTPQNDTRKKILHLNLINSPSRKYLSLEKSGCYMTSCFNRGIEAFCKIRGAIISFGAIFIVVWGLFVFSTSAHAYASPMCVELFKQDRIRILPENKYAIMDFDQSRNELHESRTVESYHVSLYSLATDANRMLDQLVDNIFVMNTVRLSPKAEKVYVESTGILFTKIETTFDLPALALEKAIELRVHERIEDEKALERAVQVRAPLGFVRLQSQTAGENIVEKIPMGFRNFAAKEDSDASAEKIPMGFALKKSSESVDSPAAPSPIGFVHFPKTPLAENSTTKQIYLDLNTGYFGIK
jgi:hypothetical protein